MTQIVLNWGFLYFPEDKSTYLPAIMKLLIMVLLCVAVFKLFRKISAKEAEKAKALEQEMLEKRVNIQTKLDDTSITSKE
jgi:flagellar biosynthesis/type III secretory pathway M-ring protein FliF/YscJ